MYYGPLFKLNTLYITIHGNGIVQSLNPLNYGVDNQSIVVKIPAGAIDFSRLQSGNIGSGAHSASPIRLVSWTVSLGAGG